MKKIDWSNLKNQVVHAFPELPDPGSPLSKALLADNWGHPVKGPFDDEIAQRKSWKDIPALALNFYEAALTYVNDAEVAHFLGAYLWRVISEMEAGGSDFSHSSSSLVFHAFNWRRGSIDRPALSPEQWKIVEAVLDAALEFEEFQDEDQFA